MEVPNRYGKIKIKPKEVSIYNEHMSGIDRADQKMTYYSSPRKTIRWYKKVFFHLLDVTTWNAFFLYRKYCIGDDKRYRYFTFREDIIKQLISVDPNIKGKDLLLPRRLHDNRRSASQLVESQRTNAATGHWPERNPIPPNSTRKTSFLKCRVCTGLLIIN